MQDKEYVNLFDVYKHYNDEVTLKIEYKPTGIDDNFNFRIDAELSKVSIHDASLCVGDFEDEPFCFDLCFKYGNDKTIYEHYLNDCFEVNLKETLVNEIQDELELLKAQKHYQIFIAMINPMFFLSILNEHENVKALLDVGAINLDFDVFVLEITIVP